MSRFDRYLDALDPKTNQEVRDFFFPNPGEPYRGVPTYSGSNFNAYSDIDVDAYNDLKPSKNPGDKLYADLIRAQTEDYIRRYAPVENFLANEITATGTGALQGDLERTRQAVLGADQNVQGMQQRSMNRMGLSYAPSVNEGQSMVGTLVGGLNDTRLRDQDRRQALLTGSLSGISQKARSTGK